MAHSQSFSNDLHSFKVDSLQLQYQFVIKGKGPELLVSHPISGSMPYQLSLSPLEAYFTVIYYDVKFLGNVESEENTFSFIRVINEMEVLRKHLGIKKAWVWGHSDQSAIAMLYALLYRENTYGLILSGTNWLENSDRIKQKRLDRERQRINESMWFQGVVKDLDYMRNSDTTVDEYGRDLSRAKLDWWCYNETSANKVKVIGDSIKSLPKRKFAQNSYFSNQELNWYLKQQNEFNRIQHPLIILQGKYDTNNPMSQTIQLINQFTRGKLVTFKYSGHYPWIEEKETFFKEIEIWLNEIGSVK